MSISSSGEKVGPTMAIKCIAESLLLCDPSKFYETKIADPISASSPLVQTTAFSCIG